MSMEEMTIKPLGISLEDQAAVIMTVQQANLDSETAVLSGCIAFKDLIRKVKIHNRKENDKEPLYQRKVDEKRLKKIKQHIEKCYEMSKKKDSSPSPLFPTSIVLAFDYDGEDNIFTTKILEPGKFVTISELPEDIMVVDGQHRIMAMKNLLDEKSYDEGLSRFIKDFHFNCSILLNYDLWEQAQVFATVNFNQKSVTKSLFYEIYGIEGPSGEAESIPKQNEIYAAHQLTRYLNTAESSPLKGRIKMLGRGKGNISQAAVVEALLKHLKISGIWQDLVEDLRANRDSKKINYIARELLLYFSAIRDTFGEYWPADNDKKVSVILKTTGIAALLRFLADLHANLREDLLKGLKENYNDPAIVKELKDYFKKQLDRVRPYGGKLFSKENGAFNGSGGGGLQKRLYEALYDFWRYGDDKKKEE